jgi:hypothetical protein
LGHFLCVYHIIVILLHKWSAGTHGINAACLVKYIKSKLHSGLRRVLTNIIYIQGKSIKTAQKIGGHKSPSTTIVCGEPPEEVISQALLAIGLPAK